MQSQSDRLTREADCDYTNNNWNSKHQDQNQTEQAVDCHLSMVHIETMLPGCPGVASSEADPINVTLQELFVTFAACGPFCP